MKKNKLTEKLYFYLGLAEARHNNVHMCFIDTLGNPITGLVHCKDYFQDMFYSFFYSKESISKYGFKWKKEENEKLKYKRKVYIVLRKHKTYEQKNILNIEKEFINTQSFFKEIPAYFQPEEIKFENNHILLKYSLSKFKFPVITSLILYLARVSLDYSGFNNIKDYINNLANTAKTYSSQDQAYLNLTKDVNILKTSKYSDFTNSSVHNNSGFVSFYNNQKNNEKNNEKNK